MVFTNTTSSPSQQDQNDDISVFLRQIIHHRSSPIPSSSSSSQPFISASSSDTPMRTHASNHDNSNNNNFNNHFPCFNTPQLHTGPSAVFSGSDRLVVDRISHDTLNGVVLPPTSLFTPPPGSNLSSESLSGSFQLPSFDNHDFPEDNECDSEERDEVLIEDVETKQQTLRNQSKRSRAAEVHNLSEKRRRSRINEKMKALQNLIPNSNKTDKASMLDEAIEYLKQLQLQVQMLSLRNGLSLHPMCTPGGLHPSQLSQMGINFDNGSSSSYDINLTDALSNTMPETSCNTSTMLNVPSQCTLVRPSLPVASTVIDSVAMPFGRESCMQPSFGPFQLQSSSQAICRERGMPHERLVDNIGTKSTVTAFSRLGHNPIERLQQKLGPQDTLLENVSSQNQMISSNFNGLLATTSGAQMTS